MWLYVLGQFPRIPFIRFSRQAIQASDFGRANNAWEETTDEFIGSDPRVEWKAAPSITQPQRRIVGFNVALTLTHIEKRR